MSETVIRACPYCRGVAALLTQHTTHRIFCTVCGLTGPGEADPAAATASWNVIADYPDQIVKLQEFLANTKEFLSGTIMLLLDEAVFDWMDYPAGLKRYANEMLDELRKTARIIREEQDV